MKAPAGLHLRQIEINGIGPWLWRAADHWAWAHPLPEFPHLRDQFLAHTKQRRVMVQAGGCMGMYPRLWAEHFDTVYTFEPDPVNFYCLTANCAAANIVKMQAALGATGGIGRLQPGPDFNAGLGAVIPDATGAVIMLSLDALNLPTVDAMQLDCEGCEAPIIEGAAATIARCKPVISIEAPDTQLRVTLEGLGYREVGRCGTMPDVVFAAT